MSRIRLLLLLSALPFAACSSDGEGPIVPEGKHTQYVVSEANVPTSNLQATEFGLDLNGDKAADNALGNVLAALVTQGFNVQGAIATAVSQGSIILLMDVQADDFTKWDHAGLQVRLGDKATAMPAPCTSAADTTCRKHLDGMGSFAVAAGSPDNAAVTGKITGGTFDGGPGNISLKIALGGPEGIQLDLIGAKAKASGMSEAGIETVILAGALTEEDLNNQVIPAIYGQLNPLVTADCTGTTPPDCGCASGSTGRTVLNLFDAPPKDCKLTLGEIQNNALIKQLLAPDVTIEGKAALSLGIKVKAVKGTIR